MSSTITGNEAAQAEAEAQAQAKAEKAKLAATPAPFPKEPDALLATQPAWALPPEEEERSQKPSRTHPDDRHPLLNPYGAYRVSSHNKEYTGTAFGVKFVDGVAEIKGLKQDALDEEIQQRRNALHYFFNTRSTGVPILELSPKTNKYEQVGITRHPTYLVEAAVPA